MKGLQKYTVIQKDRTRYTFEDYGGTQCFLITEQLLSSGTGSSWSRRWITRKEGNELYTKCMSNGFRRFADPKEIKWEA